MKYQTVLGSAPSGAWSSERRDAEASALAWLEQRLRFEAWLERVREHPGPQPGSGLATAA